MSMHKRSIGHSNPMDTLEMNGYTKAWCTMGRLVADPRTGLPRCFMAHLVALGTPTIS